MFTRIRNLFAKPVTVESVRAELAKATEQHNKARAKASRSMFVGGLILDPMTKVLRLRRRVAELRTQLDAMS